MPIHILASISPSPKAMATITRDDSDYDSSCSSSLTIPDSSQMSSRRSSISGCSSTHETYSLYNAHKPHKQNQVAWEAMNRLRCENGQVRLDHFHLIRRLGSGDLGSVYLCQLRHQRGENLYAMKVVDREALAVRNKLQRAEIEKEILCMLDHPFLPTLYAHFDASHYSCLVMEFCPGGDLYAARQRQKGNRFNISSAKFYAAEVLLALEYLHMMGVIYRDLKPENVLVREDGHIMLSDFDLSLKCDVVPRLIKSIKLDPQAQAQAQAQAVDDHKIVKCYTPTCATPLQPMLSCFLAAPKHKKKTPRVTTIRANIDQEALVDDYETELIVEPISARSKSFVGTHEYLAPEVISGQGHGSQVDWWTLGVFLYELLYGKTPFKGETNEKTLVNILKQPLSFPKMGFSNAKEHEEMVKVEDLISKLLVKNPKKRLGSIKGTAEIKRHEFFKGVNWALIRSVRPPEVPNLKDNKYCKIRTNHVLTSNRGLMVPKLSKKQRDAPFQIATCHFDYF